MYTKSEVDAKLGGILSVAPAAFRPLDATSTANIGAGGQLIMVAGGNDNFMAPVSLPHGARITALHAMLWDSHATESLRVTLSRVLRTGSFGPMAAVTSTTASDGAFQYTDSTIVQPVVDNVSYDYVLQVVDPIGNWADVGWNFGFHLRFQGAWIEYTMTPP